MEQPAGADAATATWYPYEFAITNLILFTLGIAAVFDNAEMETRSRITGSVALGVVTGLLAYRTWSSGYVPWRRTTPRLRADQRNIPGWATVLIVASTLVMIPVLWFR